MIWENYFPWNPPKTEYSGSVSKTLTGSCLLKRCKLKGITGDPVLKCTNLDAFILLDQCQFDSCKGKTDQGILYLVLTGSGSCVISSSIFVKCTSATSSSDMYKLCNIYTSNTDSGMVKLSKSSVISCGTSTLQCMHTVYIENGFQECQEMNISKCYNYGRVVDHDHTSNGITSWSHLEGNSIGYILFYFNYKGILKKSNIIRNSQTLTDNSYFGLVVTRDDGPLLVAESCYFSNNNCLSICNILTGTVQFIQCCIRDKITNTKNAIIHNNFSFEQQVLEICTPVLTKANKKYAIISVFYGIALISLLSKE